MIITCTGCSGADGDCDMCFGSGGWPGFDYASLPRRDRAWATERPAYLDIEEANRRDAQSAGELTSPSSTHDNPTGAPR